MSLKRAYLLVVAGLIAIGAHAQSQPRPATTVDDMYCAGISTTQPVHETSYIISGSQSDLRIVFKQGDLVFINRGAREGVKIGDQFLVSRVQSDTLRHSWYVGQEELMRSMGTFIADMGRLQVVDVQDRTATAEIVHACDYMQRGDMITPFEVRPSPAIKTDALNIFVPPNNKPKATIVFSKKFGQVAAAGKIVFVNLGSKQGVKVGDYFRVFKYQGESAMIAPNYPNSAYDMSGFDFGNEKYGFGKAPRAYGGKELPRDVLGEGVVLRVSSTTAAVLITSSLREIYVGSYVELE
jgi:hypothetical protein